ncbi:hypothetical protein BG015_002484 [Linnemannia schmuckeri]|uniref:Uncharacterized protein n=1 Tax=Linnemannia schmuckeri TaxID=64567 RepID=A0A9P5RS07_9FUNG|nr:hypothetical protein BG015_002484 [Linnemannia schmuckeri]
MGALFPNPNSVNAKHPISLNESTPFNKSLCLSVPNLITVLPNKFHWTVISVAIDWSMIPAISCAAKILSGSASKSNTDKKFERRDERDVGGLIPV